MGGGRILLIEPQPYRLAMAKEFGFETINPDSGDLQEQILFATNGKGADFTFDCAGHPSVADMLAKITKVRGKIVIVAAYKQPPVIDLLSVMFKELTIQGTRVYTKEDFEMAIEMLTKSVHLEKMITHVLSSNEAQKGFDSLLSGEDAIKILLHFR